MKPDDLKIGYWYKLRSEIVKLTEICGRGVICTSNGINGTGMKLTHVHNLNPATLDDLAVTLGGVKCWFVSGDPAYKIALALAAAANAPVITREQWNEINTLVAEKHHPDNPNRRYDERRVTEIDYQEVLLSMREKLIHGIMPHQVVEQIDALIAEKPTATPDKEE
ncbi:MAG: hypothetical protein PHQ43_01095 [Dehalococcoidales bacterium]|nr:hypothetical protein [Dehalococcoidales bacterium]